MRTVSKELYGYGELDGEARGRAFETWADYRHRNADALNGALFQEDLSGLKAALESVGCRLAGWSVAYDGEEGSVSVALGDRLEDELSPGSAGPDDLPVAKGGGVWVGEGFAERWNAEDRPALAAALGGGAGSGAADAYLERAQARADECLASILEDLAYYMGEEWFGRERDEGFLEQWFEEDGTYVPGA